MSNTQQSAMSHDNNHHHWSMINSLEFHPSMLQNSPGLLTALEEDSMFQPLVSIYLSVLTVPPTFSERERERERESLLFYSRRPRLQTAMCIAVWSRGREGIRDDTPDRESMELNPNGAKSQHRSLSRTNASTKPITTSSSISSSSTVCKTAMRMTPPPPYFRIKYQITPSPLFVPFARARSS